MARQSEEFLVAWSSLSGNGEEAGWKTIAVTPAGPLKLSAGRRFPNNTESLLVGFPSIRLARSERLPEAQGFIVERASAEDDGILWLALTRTAGGSPELFMEMVCNLTGSLDESAAENIPIAQLLNVFLGRVAAWQEFMRKGGHGLGAEAELGLVGELTVLLKMVATGVSTRTIIDGWLGPIRGVQDFELGTGAIEVKSTLASVGFRATIGSLEQLDDTVRQPLFVVGVRMRLINSGIRLPDFVEAVRTVIKAERASTTNFEDRLVAVGYIDSHSDRYSRRFDTVETIIVEIDDTFPRLIFGRIPIGIIRATYEVDIEKAASRRVDMNTALSKMGVR